MLELLVKDAQGTERAVRLDGTCFFGRAESCGVPIYGEGVSRRHGRFVLDEHNQWWVEDLDSKNGIYVNGCRTHRHRLSCGDTLAIGDAVITFPGAPIDQAHASDPITISQGPELSAVIERSGVIPGAMEARRLSLLYDLSHQLLSQESVAGLVEAACSALLSALEAGVVVIGLTCDPQRDTDMLFVRPSAGKRSEVSLSLSVVRRAIETKKSILVADTRSDAHLQMAQSILCADIRSVLCVPLMRDERVTGFIYVDSRRGGRGHSEQDLEFAAALGSLVGTAVEVARLHETELAKQRMEADLAAARRVQQAIMPCRWPIVEGWEIAGRHQTCREVGGDYYDALTTDRGLWLIIADVSGKGAQAALLASSVHAAVQVMVDQCTSPAELLNRLNRLLMRRQIESTFVTCLALLIPDRASEILIASAGHPSAILVPAADQPRPIELEPGFMLGTFDEANCQDLHHAQLSPGDGLLLYTDGVTEAFDEQGGQFGEQRLVQLLAGTARSAAELVDATIQGVEAFRCNREQSDDLTVLACRRTNTEQGASIS